MQWPIVFNRKPVASDLRIKQMTNFQPSPIFAKVAKRFQAVATCKIITRHKSSFYRGKLLAAPSQAASCSVGRTQARPLAAASPLADSESESGALSARADSDAGAPGLGLGTLAPWHYWAAATSH